MPALCYHIWVYSRSGTMCYRWRKCYPKQQTADAAVRRWKKYQPAGGVRPAVALGYAVLPCKGVAGNCHCRCVVKDAT